MVPLRSERRCVGAAARPLSEIARKAGRCPGPARRSMAPALLVRGMSSPKPSNSSGHKTSAAKRSSAFEPSALPTAVSESPTVASAPASRGLDGPVPESESAVVVGGKIGPAHEFVRPLDENGGPVARRAHSAITGDGFPEIRADKPRIQVSPVCDDADDESDGGPRSARSMRSERILARSGGAAGHSEAAGILVLIGAVQVLRSFRDFAGSLSQLMPGSQREAKASGGSVAADGKALDPVSDHLLVKMEQTAHNNAILRDEVRGLEGQLVKQREVLEKKLMRQLDDANLKAVAYQDEALHLRKRLNSSEMAVSRIKNTLLVMSTEAESAKVAYNRIERELVRSHERAQMLETELNLSKEQQEQLRIQRWEDVDVLQEYFSRLLGKPLATHLRVSSTGTLEPEPFWVMRVQVVMRNLGRIGVAAFAIALFCVSALTYAATCYLQPRKVVLKVLEGDTLYAMGLRLQRDVQAQHPTLDPRALQVGSTIDVKY